MNGMVYCAIHNTHLQSGEQMDYTKSSGPHKFIPAGSEDVRLQMQILICKE